MNTQTTAKEISADTKEKLTTKELCEIAVFTAIISVVSQISIPMPSGVPMTLQTLIVPLSGIVLGRKKGTYATLLYLLAGAIGIPVFSGFGAGLGKLVGITGGFLVSFPVLSYTAGLGDNLGIKFSKGRPVIYYSILVASLLIGATINYVFGTVWFMAASKSALGYALAACVVPFIPTALIKIAIAAVTGPQLKKRLRKFINA